MPSYLPWHVAWLVWLSRRGGKPLYLEQSAHQQNPKEKTAWEMKLFFHLHPCPTSSLVFAWVGRLLFVARVSGEELWAPSPPLPSLYPRDNGDCLTWTGSSYISDSDGKAITFSNKRKGEAHIHTDLWKLKGNTAFNFHLVNSPTRKMNRPLPKQKAFLRAGSITFLAGLSFPNHSQGRVDLGGVAEKYDCEVTDLRPLVIFGFFLSLFLFCCVVDDFFFIFLDSIKLIPSTTLWKSPQGRVWTVGWPRF